MQLQKYLQKICQDDLVTKCYTVWNVELKCIFKQMPKPFSSSYKISDTLYIANAKLVSGSIISKSKQ